MRRRATTSDARRVFNGKPRSPHEGVDLAAPHGSARDRAGPGRVALADELYFSGGTVILDHGAGLFTTYFHLSRIDVKAGDVARGRGAGSARSARPAARPGRICTGARGSIARGSTRSVC